MPPSVPTLVDPVPRRQGVRTSHVRVRSHRTDARRPPSGRPSDEEHLGLDDPMQPPYAVHRYECESGFASVSITSGARRGTRRVVRAAPVGRCRVARDACEELRRLGGDGGEHVGRKCLAVLTGETMEMPKVRAGFKVAEAAKGYLRARVVGRVRCGSGAARTLFGRGGREMLLSDRPSNAKSPRVQGLCGGRERRDSNPRPPA